MTANATIQQPEISMIHQLLLVARMIDRRAARDLQSEFDLKLSEWRVLAFTCNNESSTAAEICAAFATDPAEASRAVGRLIKAGLIERRLDRHHRLKRRISPTSAGRALFARVRNRWQDYSSDILQDVSPHIRGEISDALESMTHRVDDRRGPRSLQKFSSAWSDH